MYVDAVGTLPPGRDDHVVGPDDAALRRQRPLEARVRREQLVDVARPGDRGREVALRERLRVVVAGEAADLAGVDRALDPLDRRVPRRVGDVRGVVAVVEHHERRRVAHAVQRRHLPLQLRVLEQLGDRGDGPVSFSFHAMPGHPDCHGSEYLRSGSNGGLFCASIRFEKFGIRSLSSSSTQPLSIIRPRKRSLSVRTMMSRSIELPCESGRWIFPKYSAFELMSSK
jgi:hypothetical protein